MGLRRVTFILVSLVLVVWSLLLNVYHAGVAHRPVVPPGPEATGEFIDKRVAGIHQLILRGSPFGRGKKSGELTAPLLKMQETELLTQLRRFLPKDWMIHFMVLGAITWFHGAEDYLSEEDLLEMYGTSLSAPHEFDWLADGFTRQIAYHGLHEVGQMMVDRGFDNVGCTVVLVPAGTSYVLGRNFDFEAGRIFDREKILKWVFPDNGQPYVHVIWAGMVGAVTGVNASGVYVSINAAGTADRRRLGTPSTLVALRVLREALDAEQALKILSEARMFITDIFVVADAKGSIYRVEKSPSKMAVVKLTPPDAVTNHLIAPEFVNDPVNSERREQMTSLAREERALSRLKAAPKFNDTGAAVAFTLGLLRDKGIDERGKPLPIGHRSAIDALIATHSVIYSPSTSHFYVSQGPALTGEFLSYDLKKSFETGRPVMTGRLPPDPYSTPAVYDEWSANLARLEQARGLIHDGVCASALKLLSDIPGIWRRSSAYYSAMGDALECLNQHKEALNMWNSALGLKPAYASERHELERKLKK